MKFPIATISGKEVGLLLLEPDWSSPVEIAPRFDTQIGEGRTAVEDRASERAGLYLSRLKWRMSAIGADADDWRKGLAALGSRELAVPVWVDALPVAQWSERIFDPQLVINFNRDTGEYAVYAAGSLPGSPSYPLYAPLVLCRWNDRPPANAETSTVADVSIDLFEAREWSWRVGVNSYGSGWDAEPDWTSPVRDLSVKDLELVSINPLVAPALDRENAVHRWRQDADFTFVSRLEIRKALSWFVAKHGARDSWSPLPAWFQPGTATTATPASYTARFADDTLPLTFINGSIASARIGFLQEVAGSASRAAEAYLYKLEYSHDSANPELYVSGWDAPIVGAEGTFQPAQIAHKEIIRSLKPQDEKATIQLAHVEGSLAADWILGRLFGLVSVTIWKCDPANPAGRGTPLFEGYLRNVTPEGTTLTLTATLFGPLLDRRCPARVYGPRCNTFAFSPVCGLSESTHRSAGSISAGSISADGMTVTVGSVTGWGGPAAANWFAGGIFRTGSGRAKQIATIVESSEASGGTVVVKLNRPIWGDLVTSGQAVQLVPGCDGQRSTCADKFSNYNPTTSGRGFRGFPFIPEYLQTRQVGQTGAKK